MKIINKIFYKTSRILPSKLYMRIVYKKIYKRSLNFKKPVTYADKLAILKLKSKNENLSLYVDKYLVQYYVKEKIGEKHLIPNIGVFSNFDEIPWEYLPQNFVIKCTHDSQSTKIIKGKDNADYKEIRKFYTKKMKQNTYYSSREYPYKNLVPRIICQEYINDNGKPPVEYKFFCFNGKVEYIEVDQGRFSSNKSNFFDKNWSELGIIGRYGEEEHSIKPPNNLKEMIDISETLSEKFIHARIDLFNINDHIFFGEITLFPWGGIISFTPDKWNYKFGEKIKL